VLKAIIEIIKNLWRILNSPNNDPVVLGLIIAVFALLISSIRGFFNCKALLREKDKRIEDLVKERDKLQDYLLKIKGVQRKSSKN